MSVLRTVILSLMWRCVFAAPCFWGCWYFLNGTNAYLQEMPAIMAGLVLGLMGVAFLVPPVVTLLVEPSGNLFYPGQRYDKRQPMFDLPQAMRRRGQYGEAMTAYQKLSNEDPYNLRPYIEMINIAIMDLRDLGLAESILKRGVRKVRYSDGKKLKKMFAAIKSRQDGRSAKPGTVAYKQGESKVPRARHGLFKIRREN
jgi:hypothetical protein